MLRKSALSELFDGLAATMNGRYAHHFAGPVSFSLILSLTIHCHLDALEDFTAIVLAMV